VFGGFMKVINEFVKDYKVTVEEFSSSPVKHIPNILTIVRIMAIPAVIITNLSGLYAVSLIIAASAAGTDKIDGILARVLNAKSRFGEKLDTLADKGLAISLATLNILVSPFFAITLALESLIGYINIKAHKEGLVTSSSKLGKIKTVALYLSLLAGLAVPLVNDIVPLIIVTFAAATSLQIKTVLDYSKDYDKQRRRIEMKKHAAAMKKKEDNREKNRELIKQTKLKHEIEMIDVIDHFNETIEEKPPIKMKK
jgi:phosphatidylglycerophosphate synthase